MLNSKRRRRVLQIIVICGFLMIIQRMVIESNSQSETCAHVIQSFSKPNLYVEYVNGSEFQHLTPDQWKTLIKFCQPVIGNEELKMCLYPPKKDIISDWIHKKGSWEEEVFHVLITALNLVANPYYLDLGANIGSHSLRVAQNGFPTMSVEPSIFNYARLSRSAELSGLKDLVIVRNAVSDSRREVQLGLYMRENYGSVHVVEKTKRTPTSDNNIVKSVLFSDILDEVANKASVDNAIDLVVKIDIEGQECKAILGSVESLSWNEFYHIQVIVMEWRFKDVGSKCSKSEIQRLAQVLSDAGFRPYHAKMPRKLDPANSLRWPTLDMMWVHHTIENEFLTTLFPDTS
ncbi:hypothetical protein TCAL_09313, partial [Tigriopus californicus]|eukprot:TCALIF_09313-PA protein Name:"Protein of unknown function" AED:0.34 eAED:0.34 QI:101/1/0.5/1/1/1/2/0/345